MHGTRQATFAVTDPDVPGFPVTMQQAGPGAGAGSDRGGAGGSCGRTVAQLGAGEGARRRLFRHKDGESAGLTAIALLPRWQGQEAPSGPAPAPAPSPSTSPPGPVPSDLRPVRSPSVPVPSRPSPSRPVPLRPATSRSSPGPRRCRCRPHIRSPAATTAGPPGTRPHHTTLTRPVTSARVT